jgi:predicted nucleic acid-binding protein
VSLLAIDTSALLRRYVRTSGHGLVTEAMAESTTWCASALARTETLQAMHAVAVTPGQHDALWSALRSDWERFHVAPIDDRCLALAVEIGATFRVRSTDAIHLAAAARLPAPVRYLTFDRRQIPAAAGLGFEVVAPREDLEPPLG